MTAQSSSFGPPPEGLKQNVLPLQTRSSDVQLHNAWGRTLGATDVHRGRLALSEQSALRGNVRGGTTVRGRQLDVVVLADERLRRNSLVVAGTQASSRPEGSSRRARGKEEGEAGRKKSEVLHSCF